jgi:hypothetical protein
MKPSKIVAVANAAANSTSGGSKKAILLRNLGKNDVVFGTKGNGRNEVFLQLLEEYAEQYVKISKFEKMGLIQQLIREWKGNFYFLNPKTNELGLARENTKRGSDIVDQGNPSTSSKLYTSVRRMMNYVVAKNNYQYVQPTPSTSSATRRTSSENESPSAQQTKKRSISPQPVKSKKRKQVSSPQPSSKKTKKTKAKNSAPSKKTDTLSDAPPLTSVTLYNDARMDTLSPIPTMGTGTKQQRTPLLVTPEPSPRIFQQVPKNQAPNSVTEDGGGIPNAILSSGSHSGIDLPSTFASKPRGNLVRPATTTALTSRRQPKMLDYKYVHRLEDTAIQTLVSLSTASWTSEQEQEEDGLFF